MTMKVLGYAAKSAQVPLAPLEFTRRDPRPDDVVMEVLYCGVCHSDLHQARNDWGFSTYPLVPGHEVIGRVTAVGKDVTKFKVGDFAGIGCMVDSCRQCQPCQQGLEQYCEEGNVQTYNGVDRHDHTPTYGGYSQTIVASQDFVLKIPKGLDLKAAAPLLCAGITTWSPLRHWQVGKGSKVAVVGLGGLGHMALKLANALGAEVTLFTRSPSKEADARRLGAHHIVLSTDDAQMAATKGQFDLIIDTVPYVHDINPYMPTLNVNGTLVFVGYLGDLSPMINTMPLILARRSVAGSCIGGIAETQEMLDFCAKHGIASDIEMINIQDINHAYERMLKSDVKYRFVIDMASLTA
ncbi:zinc-binding dehydrogenase family protein [Yersinia rohdei]|uniref:NADP-dependent alcohol dehydrogenase n=1 Tax=Yersinia rohdei TaxID=29485 RepID=A0A0U1HNM0_YERRO|nr:NAD(P)-dependent alcohol dehydrogenase [Yersinia rohdei]AJJ10704.1 zinc-binding dehydrogenase family protein [Yersinia rohdei]CNE60964.1 NADP-dependent alcohol dehydrogenase [Yersinia rohdei]CNI45146.1 NADP-dependent alcohol dehydrogenase [Yersinia rohdei]CQI88133.1 NADP-dependent alcohol dehydrogenase [Yersinia rohdei]CQJ58045.1 NADP-dependent alcohol dehydrogenase [Yersinia rohdei]